MVVATRYSRLLRQLLPPGRLFATAPEANLSRLLDGLSRELERVHQQAEALPVELDPSRGSWSLPDWERVLGLPDECGEAPETLETRRAAVLGRVLSGDTLSRSFYYELARSLGYSIAIEEGTAAPFRVGVGRCGDRLGSEAEIFQLVVLVAGGTRRLFRTGASACGDPLQVTRDDFIECVMLRVAPAHVGVGFRYPEETEFWLEVDDELGGLIRVYSIGGEFYVVDELGDLIRIDVQDLTLLVRDENGELIMIELQEGA